MTRSVDQDRQQAFLESLLRAAVQRGDGDEVTRLLGDGVDPNAADRQGMTPLHWAVMGNDLDIVALLLRAGADPNVRERYQATPLWLAEDDFGFRDIASLLRRYGAVDK